MDAADEIPGIISVPYQNFLNRPANSLLTQRSNGLLIRR